MSIAPDTQMASSPVPQCFDRPLPRDWHRLKRTAFGRARKLVKEHKVVLDEQEMTGASITRARGGKTC